MRNGGRSLKKQGRKQVFNQAQLAELKQCVVDLAELGFPLSLRDIGEVVCSYVKDNDHHQGKQ